ncbi:hypothetical protein, partial [Streptomyces sp. NPDC050804]|uniref:hypothetical protein n=1 Tax=Streptomyces sp. NPDC050804 TaxID=3154745 RepID=UPI00342D0288
ALGAVAGTSDHPRHSPPVRDQQAGGRDHPKPAARAPVDRSRSRTAPVPVAAAPSSMRTATKAMSRAWECRVAVTSRVNVSGSSGCGRG